MRNKLPWWIVEMWEWFERLLGIDIRYLPKDSKEVDKAFKDIFGRKGGD